MLVERPHAHTKILIYAHTHMHAHKRLPEVLTAFWHDSPLFIWLLRRKRGRKRSSDYLNFLTRQPADRLISQ